MIIKNINFGYNNPLFKNSEIDIPHNGFIAITGESGCGKSTLLKIIHGQIELDDLVIEDTISDYDMIYFDQYATFDNDQSIKKVFCFYCSLYSQTFCENKMLEVLKKVNLDLNNSKIIRDLSSGQRKRLAIAIAMYINPKLIIFDEPTSSLDYNNKIQIIEFLKELSKNTTVLISSHDSDIESYYDMIYQISHCKINLQKKYIANEQNNLKQTNITKLNFKKLLKFQGSKAKRLTLLVIILFIGILHTVSFEQVLLYYQGQNTNTITNALSKNLIYFTYENIERNKLPIDYDFTSFKETDAIVDLDTNEKIKNIENVEKVYPYYQLQSTGYFTRLNDVDNLVSNVTIETTIGNKKKIELDGNEYVTPAVVPYYHEENDLKEKKGNFIDDVTAKTLGLNKSDLPFTMTVEVGMPICDTQRNENLRYFENNKLLEETYSVEVNQVIYDKQSITITINDIIDTTEYYNYYDSNGGGGYIYVEYNILENIIQSHMTTDISQRISLYDDLNEEIISYVPSNYVAFIDSVDNVKMVGNQMLKLNNRVMTYEPSSTIDETIQLRKSDKSNRFLINILYTVIGLVVMTILLYRFDKFYMNKIDFYHNIGLKTKQIISYIQKNIFNICGVFLIVNVLLSTARSLFDNELYIVDKSKMFIIYFFISLIISFIIYIYNYYLLKRLLHD